MQGMCDTNVVCQSFGNFRSDEYSRGYGGGYGQSGGYGGGYDDKGSALGSHLKSINWADQHISKFEKNFYVEDKRVSARSDKEVQDFRREKQIIVCP